MSNTTNYRWIMYVQQNIPGNVSFDLMRVQSLDAARVAFGDFCRAVYSDECSATLYPYSQEDWQSAQEFKDSGCPFDYPSRIIERGPMGGIVVNNT